MARVKPDNRPRGAFGLTRVELTPQQRRSLLLDVTNCPHCGGHHVNAEGRLADADTLVLECPTLGGRRLTATLKLFLHPLTKVRRGA